MDYEALVDRLGEMELAGHVEVHDLVCQPDGLDVVKRLLAEHGRLVIAACTSQKLKPRVDMALQHDGVTAPLITYVNIREQLAWVHKPSPEATEKALDTVHGAISLSALAEPPSVVCKDLPRHVTIIGAGIAGLECAVNLSRLGYSVALLERSDEVGGHLRRLPVIAPTGRSGPEVLGPRIDAVMSSDRIDVMLGVDVKFVEGEVGSFKVHYTADGSQEDGVIETSAVVLAMGFKEFKPTMMDEYGYGRNPDVITQYELSTMLSEGRLERPSDGGSVKEVVMVQCVGSRSEQFKRDCSKLCCTFAIDNALELLERDPAIRVHIVYMDIRVPFENEAVYRESREKGVDYIRGRVCSVWQSGNNTYLRLYDSLMDQYFQLSPDLVVLSSALLPPDGVEELAETLGYAVEYDGHVKELYGKLRRVETRRRGVFAIGAVTGPQFVSEAITDAQAAALLVHAELQGGRIETVPRGAVLDLDSCVGCSLCAQHCPRGVPLMIEQDGGADETEKIQFKAAIDILNCHACGVCQSLCPSGATELNFLTNEQLWAQTKGALSHAGRDRPVTLCFYCEECAASTIDIAGTLHMEYPASTRLIPVPCAGRVSAIDILRAFEYGAATVMIASCEKNRCHMGGTGNEIAQAQVDVTKEILSAIGWDSRRVEMYRMFSAEPERFRSAIAEMVERAHDLGPTPVHLGTAGQWKEVVS